MSTNGGARRSREEQKAEVAKIYDRMKASLRKALLGRRPFEGDALAAVLKQLALIDLKATSLKMDLGPLSEEDKAAGAEPLTPEQIAEELEAISVIVTKIVLEHLNVAPEEWYAAHDAVED